MVCKALNGFEGMYSITEDYKIYAHARVVKCPRGYRLLPGKILKPITPDKRYHGRSLDEPRYRIQCNNHTIWFWKSDIKSIWENRDT